MTQRAKSKEQRTYKILVRADANTQIGAGHIMRCLALAQAWRGNGGNVAFLSHCESEALCRRIIDEGFELIPLEKPHPDPSDLKKTLATLPSKTNSTNKINRTRGSWLVLDGNHFTTDYQKTIRDSGHKLLVIDDMALLEHYYADIVLNQNMNAEKLHYSYAPYTRLLLGTNYVMLRQEFRNICQVEKEIPKVVCNLLITLGGSDTVQKVAMLLDTVSTFTEDGTDVHVVLMGTEHKLHRELNSVRQRFPFTHIHYNMKDVTTLMMAADMALIAGGGTLWELLYLGVPVLSFSINAIQHNILRSLHNNRIIHYLEPWGEFDKDCVKETVQRISASRRIRRIFSSRGMQLIDGLGISRILAALTPC